MAVDDNKKLEYVIGNAGSAGSYRKTTTGKTLFGFGVARPNGFGNEAPPPTWYDVAVWDSTVAKQLESRIYAGAKVAVVGPVRINESNGKTYRNMSAYRIGIVEFIMPQNIPNEGPKAAPDKEDLEEVAAKIDDDLNF